MSVTPRAMLVESTSVAARSAAAVVAGELTEEITEGTCRSMDLLLEASEWEDEDDSGDALVMPVPVVEIGARAARKRFQIEDVARLPALHSLYKPWSNMAMEIVNREIVTGRFPCRASFITFSYFLKLRGELSFSLAPRDNHRIAMNALSTLMRTLRGEGYRVTGYGLFAPRLFETKGTYPETCTIKIRLPGADREVRKCVVS